MSILQTLSSQPYELPDSYASDAYLLDVGRESACGPGITPERLRGLIIEYDRLRELANERVAQDLGVVGEN